MGITDDLYYHYSNNKHNYLIIMTDLYSFVVLTILYGPLFKGKKQKYEIKSCKKIECFRVIYIYIVFITLQLITDSDISIQHTSKDEL